jgi:hypothetical protein
MATLTAIIARFSDNVDASGTIKTFVFDDLTATNADRAKQYPLALLKPGFSTIDDVTKPTGTMETHDLRLYVMDTFHQLEQKQKSEVEKWDELKAMGLALIRNVQDRSTYKLVPASVRCTPGHYQHNDDLMVVMFEFKLSAHICNGS